ncbi:MAG: MBL fold metallo-hydrolase [Halobacteria archaeon]
MEVTPVPVPGPRGPVNCYLVKSGDEGALVDAGPDPGAKAILKAVEASGLRPSAVRKLLLTHTHLNHLRGAEAILKATGAELCVSATEGFLLEHWELLAKKRAAPRRPRGGPPGRGPPGRARPPHPTVLAGDPSALLSVKPPEASVLLRNGDAVEVGSERLATLFAPGHTVGHLCFGGPGLLFGGDLLPGEGMPSFGPRPTELGDGVATSFLRSLASLENLGERVLHPGHGPSGVSLRERLAAVSETLARWEEALARALRRERRGRSLPELAALLGSPDDGVLLADAAALLEKLVLERKAQRRGDLFAGPKA